MILPIFAYGARVLKKQAKDIDKGYPGLTTLIESMWETMYNASGVGLAAPQIGKSIRLFVIDTTQISQEREVEGIKRVFINANKVTENGEDWNYEEGCLSIPDVRGDVERPTEITLKYLDEEWKEVEETFTDIEARVIQHEYDHLEGILFTELLKPVRKRRVKRKLENLKRGMAEVDYPLRFT
ncbi:MAG: peptide deformylase [Saprospiraceae bacterium]|nr:peptide deformylase [Saprospiraceae bacterium]